MRTTTKTVTFKRPFLLDGFTELLPAGTYIVETNDELLDTMIAAAWRRVSTILRVRIDGATECRTVEPGALHDALMRDGAQEAGDAFTPKSAAKIRFERAKQLAMYPSRRKELDNGSDC
jgi:hypothetical protein